MGTAGRVTRVAMAEQAGMAQLLRGQYAQCQARERTHGTACRCRGQKMHAVAEWHSGDVPDPAVPRSRTAALMPRLGTCLPLCRGQEEGAEDQSRESSSANDAFYIRNLELHPHPRAEPGFPWQRVSKLPFGTQRMFPGGAMHPAATPGGVPAEPSSPPRWWVTHFPPMALGPAQHQGFLSRCGQLAPLARHTPQRAALMFDLPWSCRARKYLLRGRGDMVGLSSTAPGSPASPSLIKWGGFNPALSCRDAAGIWLLLCSVQESHPCSIALPGWD